MIYMDPQRAMQAIERQISQAQEIKTGDSLLRGRDQDDRLAVHKRRLAQRPVMRNHPRIQKGNERILPGTTGSHSKSEPLKERGPS